MKYRTLAAALLLGSVMFTSCVDEFSELNSDPSTITKPDIRFLFTKCEASFQPGDYAQWFGGFNDLSTWSQTTVSSGGNTTRSNRPTDEANGCGYEVNEVLRYANEIRYQISQLPEEEKATYEYIQYLCNPLLVYLSIQDADLYGSRQYTEAEQARYTNPPLLLPKYDTQEELLEVWLKELDQTINYLSSNEIKDVLNNQDFIYKGDLKKWGKLANSLKLKIAARLINKDRNRAFEIVKQVAESPVGLIATTDDDFVYNKGKFDNNWNNDFSVGVGTQHLIDFLVNNKDPRLLYFFQKNDYNSNVVQAYFDQKREMPDFVEKNVISEVKNGKKVFKEWGGPGEPWVRYYGLPVEIGAGQMDKYEDYFDPTGQLFVLYSAAGAKKSYYPCTYRNQEMVKGLLTYTYPDAPDVTPVQDTQQYGWYGLYFSAAETNFFLAEFTLLGATWNGQKSAQEYFTDGITASVKGYDYVAGQNHIPYYDSPYVNDPHDVSIKLQEEWLTELLKKEAYNLSGDKASDLEKVYIQEYLHYFNAPIDQYVNIMRSGVPMKNSSILPRKEFDEQLGDSYPIPRRFAVMEPLESDQLHDITIAAYKAQGYTYQGTNAKNPQVLHDERVWMDKENPDFGKGPKTRSTVGTVTEIYDYLRLLWARVGTPHCPKCGKEIRQQTIDQIIDQVLSLPEGTRIQVMAPVIRGKKGEHAKIFEDAKRSGYVRARVDGNLYELDEEIKLEKNKKHNIEIVVDRLVIREDIARRLTDSVEIASNLSGGLVVVNVVGEDRDILFSQNYACEDCGVSIEELTPRMFSFNNPYGACPACTGLGSQLKVDPELIIPNKDLSILEGAITASGWSNIKSDGIARMYFDALAKKYRFKLDTPVKNLSPEVMDVILYGTRGEELTLHYDQPRARAPCTRPLRGSATTWSAGTRRPSPTPCAGSWRTA